VTRQEYTAAAHLNEQFGYAYDAAQNLNRRTNNALVQAFGVDNLNQLTTATRSGTLTVAGTTTAAATNVTVNGSVANRYADNTFALGGFNLTDGTNTFTAIAADSLGRWDTNTVSVNLPATVSFSYDANGNLTGDGRRIFAYDDENQLISVIVTNSTGSSTKSEFAYDGKLRRRVRKDYTWSSGIWNLVSEIRYIYDGNLGIQERDGNNLPTLTLTRGLDLSGTRKGAGGIGGLLARTDAGSGQSAFFHADGSGNVTALVNAQQAVVARYTYDPYGTLVAKSGPLADASLYRFSSKETHVGTGLVYFGLRFYDPNLQRWLTPDPLGEAISMNLFAFVRNRPLWAVDAFGLDEKFLKPPGGSKWEEPKLPWDKIFKAFTDQSSAGTLMPDGSVQGASGTSVLGLSPAGVVEDAKAFAKDNPLVAGSGVVAGVGAYLGLQYALTDEMGLGGTSPWVKLTDELSAKVGGDFKFEGEWGYSAEAQLKLQPNPAVEFVLKAEGGVDPEGAATLDVSLIANVKASKNVQFGAGCKVTHDSQSGNSVVVGIQGTVNFK